MIQRSFLALLAVLFLSAPAIYAEPPVPGSTWSYVETFESFLSGQSPSASWYSVSTTGSGAEQVFATTAISGAKAWRVTDTATGYAAHMTHNQGSVNVCTPGAVFSWKFQVEPSGALSTTEQWELSITSAAATGAPLPADSIGLRVTGATGAETISGWIRGTSGTAMTPVTLSTIYNGGDTVNAQISQINCTGTAASALFTLTGGVTASQTITATAGQTLSTGVKHLNAASTGATSTGTNLLIDDYNFNQVVGPAPTAASISPTSGSDAGGQSFTITGTGYFGTPSVTFDGIAATGISLSGCSATTSVCTTLTGTTPAHAPGGVDVAITNQDGQAATLASGYTYTATPGSPGCTGAVDQTWDLEANTLNEVAPTACWFTWQQASVGTPSNFKAISSSADSQCAAAVNGLDCGTLLLHLSSSSQVNERMHIVGRPDLCNGDPFHYSFDARLFSSSATTSQLRIGLAKSSSTQAGMLTGGSGNPPAIASNPFDFGASSAPGGHIWDGSAGTEVAWAPNADDTGNMIHVDYVITCDGAGATMTATSFPWVNPSGVKTTSVSRAGNYAGSELTMYAQSGTTGEWYFDNLFIEGQGLTTAGDETVAILDGPLVGMVVDDEDATMAVRVMNGERVRTYDPFDLATTRPSMDTPDCPPNPAIGAYRGALTQDDYIIYAECAADGTVQEFSIRDPYFNEPNTSCLGANLCPQEDPSCNDGDNEDYCLQPNLGDTDIDGEFPDVVGGIGEMHVAPWDFSRTESSLGNEQRRLLGLAYSEPEEGRVGVLGYLFRAQNQDTGEGKSLPIGSPTDVVQDLCTTPDFSFESNPDIDQHRDFVAGVTDNSVTKLWRSTISHQAANVAFGSNNEDVDVGFESIYSTGGINANKVAIDCSQRMVLAEDGNYYADLEKAVFAVGGTSGVDVFLKGFNGGFQQGLHIALSNVLPRSVSLSPSGPFLLVSDAANHYVYYLNDYLTAPELKCTKAYTGTFVDSTISSYNADVFWFATANTVNRRDCGEVVGDPNTSTSGPGEFPQPPSGTPGSTPLAYDDDCDHDGTTNASDPDDDNDGIPDSQDNTNLVCGTGLGEGPGNNNSPGNLGQLPDGLMKNTAIALAAAFGVSLEAGGLILCIILILFFAAAAGWLGAAYNKEGKQISKGWGPMGFAIGAVLGFALCLALGLVALVYAFVITMVCTAVVGIKYFRDRSG